MNSFFYIIKNLFNYKGPENPEGNFELLENDNEGTERNKETVLNNTRSDDKKEIAQSSKVKQDKELKLPLSVDQWNKSKNTQSHTENNQASDEGKVQCVLSKNVEFISSKFNMSKNKDVIIREFNVAQKHDALIVFMDGMADKNIINEFILPQLMDPQKFKNFDARNVNLVKYIIKNVLSINEVTVAKEYNDVVRQVLNGVTALFIDGSDECILLESRGYEKRAVDKPQVEQVVKGAQEAFNENMRTNITLVRRIIRNENLITETLTVSKTNHENCAVMYLEGVVNPELVKEVKRRLESIDIDFICGDGMLEQMIEDNSFMLFPQVLSTERPDRAASFIMEGQVIIIADGTPMALTVPVTFFRLFHTSEDAMLRWQYATFIRFIRLLGIAITILLPGLYISLVLFHQEMIPTTLLANIFETREKIPFPVIIEALIMELSFELIREGGIRIPGVIGQTLGIVGALILGQATVSAGLVSPIMIIIVALTAIGSFVIPNYTMSLAFRVARFIFIFLGALLGFLGIAAGITITGVTACGMKSFGVPFLSPVAPRTNINPDLFIRQPIWKQKMRADYLNTQNRQRAGDNPRGWKKTRNGGNKQ